MTSTGSLIDLLSTNLACIFHRYLLINNNQTCVHKLSSTKNVLTSNARKKVRINVSKYGHLLNSIVIQDNIPFNANQLKKKTDLSKQKKKKKVKKKDERRMKNGSLKAHILEENEQQQSSSKTITKSSSVSILSNQIRTQSPEDLTLVTEDHQSSERLTHSSSTLQITSESSSIPRTKPETSIQKEGNSLTLHRTDQCREKIRLIYNTDSIVNQNCINTRKLSNDFDEINTLQHKSNRLKHEQLFGCPKGSKSKRRRCCGVYYEFFDDVWRLFEGWFTTE